MNEKREMVVRRRDERVSDHVLLYHGMPLFRGTGHRERSPPPHIPCARTVYERYVFPERHRLQSPSIPLGPDPHRTVSHEPSELLRILDMGMAHRPFSTPANPMRAISPFAPNITVLKLRHVTISLSSPAFPLEKLMFRVITANYPNPVPADLVCSLNRCPPHRRV